MFATAFPDRESWTAAEDVVVAPLLISSGGEAVREEGNEPTAKGPLPPPDDGIGVGVRLFAGRQSV